MAIDVGVDPSDTLAGIGGAWGWAVFFGVVSVITGILVMVWPEATLVVVAVLFGIQLLIGGIFRFVAAFAFSDEAGGARVLTAILGILSALIGLYLLRHLGLTLATMALVLGMFWIIHGAVETFTAIANRGSGSRWVSLLSGILGIIAGIIVFAYPGISLVALTWILGFWLIMFGLLQLVTGFRTRRAVKMAAA